MVDDPARAREQLTEALSIWAAGGAGPAVARVEVLIGRLHDADGTERSRARESARSLRQLGIHVVDGRPAASDGGGGVVSISVLGPFSVTVDGRVVPLPAWRSKQARTLVKILAAQRGRVVTRARFVRPAVAGRRPGAHRAPALGAARHGPRCARPGEGLAT